MPRAAADAAVANLQDCASYVIATYSSAAAYRGTVGLGGELPRVMEELIASGKPVTLVALGNPYLLRDFPNVSAYLATFSTTPTSEIAAVRGLFGEIPIAGRLPVSIPGLAQLGEGLQLDAIHPLTADAR
jgi:beta-N-acetylhexosaminidase